MGIHSDWLWHRERWCGFKPHSQFYSGDNNTSDGNNCHRGNRSNRSTNKFLRLIRSLNSRTIYNLRTRRKFPIYSKLFWARDDQPDNNTKSNRRKIRHRYNKYVYAIGASLLTVVNPTIALAENVGGVSATANPIANSSGSVTNQAIQVLQGPYVTNTYGNQISCQGSTFNATPYIQYSNTWSDPFERVYYEPQYNNIDVEGKTVEQQVTVKNYPWESWYDTRVRTDPNDPKYDEDGDGNPDRWWEDGADMVITQDVVVGDGIPDNPGQVIWQKPVRTEMKANNNFNLGLSATFSLPLDKKLQKLCKEAATTQIEQQKQLTANKRLDFEIARLKNCGELMKSGIMFHPKSPYASICADVVLVTPPGTIKPHSHDLPQLTFPEGDGQPLQQHSPPSASTSSLEEIESSLSSPSSSESSPSPSLSQALSLSGVNPLGVWQVGQMKSLPQQ